MMMQTSESTSLEAFFRSELPQSTDETVREYVWSLLEDLQKGEVVDDTEDIVETVASFLDGNCDLAERLVQQCIVLKAKADEAPVTATRLPVVDAIENSVATPILSKETRQRISATTTATAPTASEDHTTTGGDDDSSSSSSPVPNRKSKKGRRNKSSRKQKRQDKQEQRNSNTGEEVWEDDDDFATAWKDCQEQGLEWGGRGRGGRGVQASSNSFKSNIHLSNITIGMQGMTLLDNATIDIQKGHRYGIIGRNGIGKSTVLRRLAQKSIPGMPMDLKILLVQQHMEGSETRSALQELLNADTHRTNLLQEQAHLEERLEADDDDDGSSTKPLEELVGRLGEIVEELEFLNADTAEERALEILKGLQFTEEMIHGTTSKLSGGWRMRLALARALFVSSSDLLLLDECTNHLDLYGLEWIVQYITSRTDRTILVVSHDRSFLDAICTDTLVMEHGKIKHYVGNCADYERQQSEKAARESQILDAAERQRAKAEAFIQKTQQNSRKSADPNKQRQAKTIKDKKLARIGNYREDGKRYKNFSLKKLSEDHILLSQKVQIEADEAVIRLQLPQPIWPPSIQPGTAIVRMENFSFAYPGQKDTAILKNLTLNLNRGSKVALVGRNGAGKSTLVKLIAGDIPINNSSRQGLWRHANLRIGHATQYVVEELQESYAHLSVVQYADKVLAGGKASSSIAAGNIRQYLGAFGLGDSKHAHQLIGKLSGGERMRLCFATVFAEQPQLLILDESTNHVDLETLDVLSSALHAFQGAIVMVSHNQGFLSGFCNELWELEDGSVKVNHSDTTSNTTESASFDELFSHYREKILSKGRDGTSMNRVRQEKAQMAKQASKQRAGASRNTALL